MSSPIFDSTFGTGRFRREEPMTTSDPSQATPADELRRQIMDPNIPKNEREWWAAQEIERLAALAPSPEPQNVRETPGEIARKLAVIELGVSDETFIGKIAAAIRAALAQSDAELIAERDLLKRGAEAWRPMVEGLEKRIALLERYADSIAMWMERENVTDQERLSYIKGHPITRAAADRGVHGELIPDCPTDGVAARQGNGG